VYANDSLGRIGSDTINVAVYLTGYLLNPGSNYIDGLQGAYGLILNLNMARQTRLIAIPSQVQTPDPILSHLPMGWKAASTHMYGFVFIERNAFISGTGIITYNQSFVANEVYENDLKVMRWDSSTSTWLDTASVLNKSRNQVTFNLASDGGIYLLVSTPKKNYDIVVISIIIIGISAAIVATVSYRQYSKKVTASTKSRSKKSISSMQYTNAAEQVSEGKLEALKKRQRMMNAGDGSSPTSTTASLSTMPDASAGQKALKKSATSHADDVDLDRRVKNATAMQSEVSVEPIVARCLVHKGEISGLNYKCNACGATYCLDCARHLAETNEPCWNCKSQIPRTIIDAPKQDIAGLIPKTTISMFSKQVWEKLDQLESEGRITPDIFDEVIAYLKQLAPAERLNYLNSDMFTSDVPDENDE
nr:hypothetical protein [Candidatus Sigynarchaeota archaeon]